MNAVLDPVGFLADSIAIANALGFYTPAQEEQSEKLSKAIQAMSEGIDDLSDLIDIRAERITNMIATATVIEVRSRVDDVKEIRSDKLELLIKLLFCIKQCASNVIFAIIVKYKIAKNVATLGFAASSSDAIEEIVRKVDRFLRSVAVVKKEKSTYINVRIRGKYESRIENFCSAALSKIATEVCGLSPNVNLGNVMECTLEAIGHSTTVLLQPAEYEEERTDFDRLRRVFLVGDTRTGKSTFGNALMKQGVFHISRGMTGTMRIERGERVEEVDDELWVTEIYDTPGLNDKDGLDILYETAIADHIRILQRASTLIMTVSVDAGITQAALKSLDSYKALFGDSIASMLIVVLTVNEPADAAGLQDYLNLNWPTIAGLDSRIKERNVFCVSLHDLRAKKDSASHAVVEEIAVICRGMPLKLIEALSIRYRKLREALKKKTGDLEKTVQTLIDEGWQKFDYLTEKYEQSSYVKMTDSFMDGFVCKQTGPTRQAMAYLSAGLINAIRKDAIHVDAKGKFAEKVWQSFYGGHILHPHDSNLMRLLGDNLYEVGLAVMVNDWGVTHIGTLRVRRYNVIIFDPISHAHEELYAHLQDIYNEKFEGMRTELISDLVKSIIPPAVRYKRRGRRREREDHGTCSGKTLGISSNAGAPDF